ncbi:MAG: hypothetical protein J6T87_02320 [Bacteroidales bacterium]|nr:hypothetical protein [Bacteroidales bacterium]
MIKRFILVAVAMMAFMTMMAQNSVTLTFTGQDLNHDYAPLSYVEIDNYSRGWSERIYFPDTIFTMTVGSGIDDYQRDPGEMQVMPNPFDGKTTVNFHSTKNETVKLLITDISGKQYAEYQGGFVTGDNMFSIVLTTPQTYILSLQTGSGMTRSVKMINVGRGEKNLIRKEENMKNPAAVNLKTLSTNPFELGDQMCYTGYAINYAGEVVSGTPIIKQQYTNETILFILPINPILPTVTTNPPTNVMETSATINGNVASTGGATVTARGFCWSTSPNPTLSDDHSTNGSGPGSFSYTITDLVPTTTYYVRAYATNIVGTAYGNEHTFTTQAITIPTVTTNPPTNVMETSATFSGNVTSTGGATVTARGFCWSTSPNPTLAGDHSTNGSGTGSFSYTITDLVPTTTYYVRAYATNSAGTGYGAERSFTTLSLDGQPCPGTPTMVDIDNNEYATVQIGTQCWMKRNLRTSRFADGTGISHGRSGSFDTYLSDSIATALYAMDYGNIINTHAAYRRGFLYNWSAAMKRQLNPDGTALDICPEGWHLPSDSEWTVLTNYVGSKSNYQCNGNPLYIAKALASDVQPLHGDLGNPDYGYCWATPHYETTFLCAPSNNVVSNNATEFDAFPSAYWFYTNDGLPNIDFSIAEARWWTSTKQDASHVYVRRIHHDSATVSTALNETYNYAAVRCVRNEGSNLPTPTLPSVRTMEVSNISGMSAYATGNVTSNGGAYVSSFGICWSTSPNPTLNDSHTTQYGNLGMFTDFMPSLDVNTTYYVRAYATNSVGTAYGDLQMFTTLPLADAQPCAGAATVTDYDGNTYNTVQIGNQCWMKENMRATHFADGTPIAFRPASVSDNDITPYISYPNDDSTNVSICGYDYNWYAAMRNAASSNATPSGVQGICPNGWHVPSFAETSALVDYVYSQPQYVCSGKILKAMAANTDWSTNGTDPCSPTTDLSTNNATGYSAKSIGAHNSMGGWYYENEIKQWTATEYSNSKAMYVWFRLPGYDVNLAQSMSKDWKMTVRCIRSEESDSTATVKTLSVGGVSMSSATCGGEVTYAGASAVTSRGVCWSTSPNPSIADSHTEDGHGAGGFISTISGLNPGTVYYVRAYAVNSEGVAYGEPRVFTTSTDVVDGRPCPLTPTVMDVDSNSYPTIQIGNQCWMKQNLRTTHYANGVNINNISIPNGDSNLVAQYGYMYFVDNYNYTPTSTGISENQGVCPTGWHLPNLQEWNVLLFYVKSQPDYRCGINDNNVVAKALSAPFDWITDYDECNPGFSQVTNNLTGFSALPSGIKGSCGGQASEGYGVDYNFGVEVSFWAYPSGALGYAGVGSSTVPCGLSSSTYVRLPVRCLRDQSIVEENNR